MPPNAAPLLLNSNWHYHFLGIGGIGMSGLAQVLHRMGFHVSGSDSQDSAALRQLASSGIPVAVGHSAESLAGAHAVVYSTAISPGHPIWAAVEARGLQRFHRAQLLGSLSRERRTVAVSGTHGKTTTSACLAWVMDRAGCDPTALVGGYVPQLGGSNYRLGAGPWLVLEADESDGSFMHLAPDAIAITNIEDDHLDHHGTAENLMTSFREFVDLLPADGLLVYCSDDAPAAEVASGHAGQRIGYGLHPDADVRVEPLVDEPALTPKGPQPTPGRGRAAQRIALHWKEERHELDLNIPGVHNALNLAGVFALTLGLDLDRATVLDGLQSYTGVARRQQLIGELPGLRIYDDYAHHPTEIRATLAAFQALHGEPITVVFQPHLYSRTARLATEFADALRPAERIFVTDVYGAREAPQPGISGKLILDSLTGHPNAHYVPTWTAAGEELARNPPRGILLTMGAGDITELGPWLLRGSRGG